ncbi:MAG: elongation factor P [bacterium]|nr:elongation factor P [bacterium]
MISANEFKNGMTIELDGMLYEIISFQHVKPGKGGAFVRTRLKDIKEERMIEKTFRAEEKVTQAILEQRSMLCLYKNSNNYYFMDNETFEHVSVPLDILGNAVNYLKENMQVTLSTYKDEIIKVTPPIFVELEVKKTSPGVKGDTVSSGTKPATLETGLTVQIPLFISEGDTVRIDTRTGEYIERV